MDTTLSKRYRFRPFSTRLLRFWVPPNVPLLLLRMARIDLHLEWKLFYITQQEHFVEPVSFLLSKTKRRIYSYGTRSYSSSYWLDHFNTYRRHFVLSRSLNLSTIFFDPVSKRYTKRRTLPYKHSPS